MIFIVYFFDQFSFCHYQMSYFVCKEKLGVENWLVRLKGLSTITIFLYVGDLLASMELHTLHFLYFLDKTKVTRHNLYKPNDLSIQGLS